MGLARFIGLLLLVLQLVVHKLELLVEDGLVLRPGLLCDLESVLGVLQLLLELLDSLVIL